MISGLGTALKQLFFGSPQSSPYVCFVRKHLTGYELARLLGITVDTLWKCNPNIPDFDSTWGGQLILVPQSATRAQQPWEDTAGDFTLTPWPARAEDFPTYPQKDELVDPQWVPPVPTDLKPISGAVARDATWGRFEFVDAPTADNPEGIRITGGWESANIGMVQVHGLAGLTRGSMQFNKKCHTQLQGLWADWVRYDMRRHIHTFDGSFVPRYQRQATHTRENLSNHAWGTAFDINANWNKLGHKPAHLGAHGSVLDLVEIANKWGFFWGGHFGTRRADGMHFEVAKIL